MRPVFKFSGFFSVKSQAAKSRFGSYYLKKPVCRHLIYKKLVKYTQRDLLSGFSKGYNFENFTPKKLFD
jgi:hypothetical protein